MEEYGGSTHSDNTDDEDDNKSNVNTVRTSEIFNIAEPLSDRPTYQDPGFTQEDEDEDEDYMATRQLTLFSKTSVKYVYEQ